MAQMKTLTIRDEQLKVAGDEIKKEVYQMWEFYFISRNGHKVVEIMKRKETVQRGKIIVLTKRDIKYFGAVNISTTKFGTMKLKCHIPSMEIIFLN